VCSELVISALNLYVALGDERIVKCVEMILTTVLAG
jgi:hypothetical protein